MIGKNLELISLLEKAFQEPVQNNLEEIGTVVKISDNICRVYGLTNAMYGELIVFEGGNKGIVLDLDEDFVAIILFDQTIPVVEQEIAHRTGKMFCVPVGEELLGRVIDALGTPLDAGGAINCKTSMPIEQIAPDIIDRSPVSTPLETGITVIDCLIPIGRGQRELLIGNRNTGKTNIALDIILHQKDQNVICIYVSIGHKQSNTSKLIDTLERHGAMAYTIVLVADAQETALKQFLSAYSGCTIGEYFANQGKDVLIIYDDLSNHAIAHRELSLLLRRPPGREAYPGDIFYIHSRLLERACKLSPERGGGSLTAIPVIQIQSNDISAYIPTNLISITDGQIILDPDLFNAGIRPAVNVGLSVSRVGGAAQTKAIKKVIGSLKLELAQYEELLAFSQFGSELSKSNQRAIDRGARAIELLKQAPHQTISFVDQTIYLFLLKEHYLDVISLDKVALFVKNCVSYIKTINPKLYDTIFTTKELSHESIEGLHKIAHEFSLSFPKSS